MLLEVGRNPTKLEFLSALRRSGNRGAFSDVSCVALSRSLQTIPLPEVNGDGSIKKLNGVRCASGTGINGRAWITWTDDPNDSTIEMTNVRPLSPGDVCGTAPVGLKLNQRCGETGAISSVEANADVSTMSKLGTAVFTEMTKDAVGELDENGVPKGKGECTECHKAIPRPANANPPPELCLNFAFDVFDMICPLPGGMEARCGLFEGAPPATCADGEPPKCKSAWQPNPDGKSYSMNSTPSCKDGSVPACGGGVTASCVNASLPVPPAPIGSGNSRQCAAITLLEANTTDAAKLDFYFELKQMLGCTSVGRP